VKAEHDGAVVQQCVNGLSPQQWEAVREFRFWLERHPHLKSLSLEDALDLYTWEHPDALILTDAFGKVPEAGGVGGASAAPNILGD
jgi:hypothetical protein